MALKPIELESVDRFTTLIVGEAGIGKTSLIRTIAEDEPVCMLSAESGLLCVRDLVKSKRLQGFEITSFADMREAYQYLLSDKAINFFKWIFIDSLTEISSRCVEAMKTKYPSGSDGFKMWGDYNDQLTFLIKSYRDLHHYSVVFTCLPTVDKDENNKRYVGTAVSGSSIKERLTSYFDEVFYMTYQKGEDGKNYRCFITQPYDRYPAKDRSGTLSLIEPPDLSSIKNKILKKENVDNEN